MIPTRLAKTTLEQKDDGVAPIIQVEYLTQVKNAVHVAPYGVHSSPELNTPCLLITINHDPSNAFILPFSMIERKNVAELEKGEVILGNFTKKASILFDKDGNIDVNTLNGNLNATISGTANIKSGGDMTAEAPNINIKGATNITGNTVVTGNLGNTAVLTAGNGATGTFLNSVTVLNGIVTGGT